MSEALLNNNDLILKLERALVFLDDEDRYQREAYALIQLVIDKMGSK